MTLICDRQLLLIVGPSGAGKTTYLRERVAGCLILDLELILDALLFQRKYYPAARKVAETMFQSGWACALSTGANLAVTAWGATRRERQQLVAPAKAAGYRVTMIFLQVPIEECLRRCRADPQRPRTTDWRPILANWFKRFEPITADEADEISEIAL